MNPNDIINLLMNRFMNNMPKSDMASNFMRMYQSGDSAGIEQMARNILKANNMTLDQAKEQIMKMFIR